ncbi:MAG: Pr6Pr family membrane protein [Bacteroidota bacterium]|nr:Pr6Pr family membrane protein [Bacteroidota bacterium]MDP4259028.1 Pr6Pr family membrane protein [Bacteroidota bacterium]
MTITLDEKRMTMTCGALLAWLAVLLQLVLMLRNRTTSTAEALARFFTFFTILTNILTALCFTLIWIKPASSGGRFFARPGSQTATAVYILMVGIIYNTLLRSLWHPYPFMDVAQLGYGRVLMHSAGMLAAFLLLSVLFLALAKVKGTRFFN